MNGEAMLVVPNAHHHMVAALIRRIHEAKVADTADLVLWEPASRSGWHFAGKFERADVSMGLQSHAANIDWH
jgi:hypothetical protein